MKRIQKLIPALCAIAALGLGGAAYAQDHDADDAPATTTTTWSPFAFNAWAGIAYDYVHFSGDTTLSSSDGKLGANFGGDLGFRFSPEVAVVALFEYAPIFSSDVASHLINVGGGLRFQGQSSPGQFLLAGTYSNLSGGGSTTGGWGAKLMGFYPLSSGFGPYLQLAYNRFGPSGGTLDIFSANAGLSLSL